MNSEETIGQRVKRLRLAHGFSQRDLQEPGVSYAYISRIEAGTRQPSVKALRKLAARLGVSADYIETGVHPPTGFYVLHRTSEGQTTTIGLFADEMEADEWAAVMTAAENQGQTPRFPDPLWDVEFVPFMDDAYGAEIVADRASEPVEWQIKTKEATCTKTAAATT